MEYIDINLVHPNPDNPRVLSDNKYQTLLQSIRDFPDMLQKRPLICYTDRETDKLIVLGGNMRLKAAKEAGLARIPVILANNWTPEQRKEFIVKDNLSYGEWDYEQLANDWDQEDLTTWGVDIPGLTDPEEKKNNPEDYKNKLKITFASIEDREAAEAEIEALITKYAGATYKAVK